MKISLTTIEPTQESKLLMLAPGKNINVLAISWFSAPTSKGAGVLDYWNGLIFKYSYYSVIRSLNPKKTFIDRIIF